MESVNPEQASIIGRDEELRRLKELFDSSMAGNGKAVFITGAPGIGKTRLVQELGRWAEESGSLFITGSCSANERSEPYHPFRKALKQLDREEVLSLEDRTSFDELFLISSIGLLITHLSKSEEEGVDEDILSSMLTAVQDFVKDSFGDGGTAAQKGGLGRLEYKNKKVLIEHGKTIFLAGVVSGQEHHRMRDDLKKTLKNIEAEFAEELTDWNGDLDKVMGTRDHLQKLIESGYPVKRTVESMNIEAERLEVQERLLETLAENSPNGLVLALEDIHNADETSLLAVPFLARNISGSRIMICATLEPNDSNDALNTMTETIGLESTAEIVELKDLAKDDVRALVSSNLGDKDVPEELVRHLYGEGGGNPFFTTELLRTMRSDRILTRKDDVWIFRSEKAEKLPSSVSEIVARQLEELDIESLHILEFSSVLGMSFEPQIISVGMAKTMPNVEKVLDRLRDLNLLAKAESDYEFTHGTVHDAVYSHLSARWKKVLHKNAAQSLEFVYQYDIDSVLFKLAYHFARTNDYEKGIEYSIEAGEKAVGTHSPREAVSFFEDAERLIHNFDVQHPKNMDIHLSLSELYELIGRYDDAIRASEEAKSLCGDCGGMADIDKKLGFIFFAKSDYDNSISHFEKAVESAKEAGDELLLAGIYGGMGKVYLRKGEYDKSLDIQKNYLEVSRNIGDDKEIGQAYLNLGGVYWHMTDFPKTRESWEKSLEHMTSANDELGIAYAHNNLGVLNEKLGRLDEALENYVPCILLKKKLGDIRGIAMTHNNIGIIYDLKGEYPDAIENYKKSLEIRHKIGDMNGIANAYNNLGTSSYLAGNYEDSLMFFGKYLDAVIAIDDTWGIALAYSNMSETEIELGMLEESLEHSRKAIDMASKHEFKDVLSPAYKNQGIAMVRLKMWDEAFRSIEKCIGISEEIGEPGKLGKAYLAAGTAYLEKGEAAKGREHVSKALRIFEKAGMKGLLDDAKAVIGKIS